MSMLILPSPGQRRRNRLTNLSHFTGADGTDVTVYLPELGGMWSVARGAFDLQSNAMHQTALAENLAYVESGTSDHIATLVGRVTSGTYATGNWNILGRYQDASNFWSGSISSDGLRIYKVQNSSTVQIAYAAMTPVVGTWYRLIMVSVGPVISLCAMNHSTGQMLASLATSNTFLQSATRVGIRAFNNSVSSIGLDQFYVGPA